MTTPMRTRYFRNGIDITNIDFIGSDGTTYLAGYAAGCTDEELVALGITKVVEAPPPAPTEEEIAAMQAQMFTMMRSSLTVQIDAEVDAIYERATGNRQFEYTEAERQALAYKDAGYTGTVPAYVASWVTASGKTATAATNDILSQAGAWRAAAGAMRAARLGHKAQATAATTQAALDAVRASWVTTIGQIRAALGL